MVFLFSTGEITRKSDDNGILPDECARMLIFRAFDAVSGRLVLHKGAQYTAGPSFSLPMENCKKFLMFSGYFMWKKSQSKMKLGE